MHLVCKPLTISAVLTMLSKKEFLVGALYTAIIAVTVMAIAGFYKMNGKILAIVEYPHPVLRQVAHPIQDIDYSVVALVDDIIATLRYRTLVDFFVDRSVPRGIAAPQVGISKRLVVCGINGRIKVLINPEIVERKGSYLDRDGCLSVVEEEEVPIERPAYVKVRYKTLANREKILVAKDNDAALLEHEIDHLNGILTIDYILD